MEQPLRTDRQTLLSAIFTSTSVKRNRGMDDVQRSGKEEKCITTIFLSSKGGAGEYFFFLSVLGPPFFLPGRTIHVSDAGDLNIAH